MNAILCQTSKENFDWGIHYFRGFAICCIVIWHLMQYNVGEAFGRAFFQGSTVYFLFISGYLCQFLDLRHRDSPFRYYAKKLKNVILPYLIFSALTLILVCCFSIQRRALVQSFDISVCQLVKIFGRGEAHCAYWYIPFVSVLFFVSPLLVRLRTKSLGLLTFAMFFVAVLFPKRGTFHSIANMYIYFTWPYLVGFLYARYKSNVDLYLKPLFFPTFFIGLLAGVWVYCPGLLGQYLGSEQLTQSLQKIFFTVGVLFLLNVVKDRRIWLLDQFAKYSFTIYFIHSFFIADYALAYDYMISFIGPGRGAVIIASLMLVPVYLFLMLVLSMFLKFITGKFSRSIIGS